MTPDDSKGIDPGASSGWVPHGNTGYEITRCPSIIAGRLAELKQRRAPLALVQENYQSGVTLLIGTEGNHLLIDKPRDWPGNRDPIRVIFQDRNKLWNHFYCKLVKTDRETLYVTKPSSLFLLQRREHYRVEVPGGSVATFVHTRKPFKDIPLKDLSAGGMLLVSKKPFPFETGDSLQRIRLTIPFESKGYPATLLCGEGNVVRAMQDTQRRLFFFAIKFHPTAQEMEAIIKYVRQRELELLRKTGNMDL